MSDPVWVTVEIEGDFTAQEREKELVRLSQDFSKAGVAVRRSPSTTSPPEGAKAGGDAVTQVLVSLGTPALGLGVSLIVESWNKRHHHRAALYLRGPGGERYDVTTVPKERGSERED